MSNPQSFRIRLDRVRADWPELFTAVQFKDSGNFRCGIKLIFGEEHPQWRDVQQLIEAAAAEKWKSRAADVLRSLKAKDNCCLRDGNLQAKAPDGYRDQWVLSANCAGGKTEAQAVKPQVRDRARNIITDPNRNPIYRGCYVNAIVEFYGDDRYAGPQINCKLIAVQFADEGDAFGSPSARDDDFENLAAEQGVGADDFV